jgi:hypothetical protein
VVEKAHAQEVRELDEQKLYIEDQLALIPATPIFLSKFFSQDQVMVVSLLVALLFSWKGLAEPLSPGTAVRRRIGRGFRSPGCQASYPPKIHRG